MASPCCTARSTRRWKTRIFSCIRLRPEHRNHVWSYDFVEAQTHDGRKLRLLTLIDEFNRECLAIRVARRISSFGVIEAAAGASVVCFTRAAVRPATWIGPNDYANR